MAQKGRCDRRLKGGELKLIRFVSTENEADRGVTNAAHCERRGKSQAYKRTTEEEGEENEGKGVLRESLERSMLSHN